MSRDYSPLRQIVTLNSLQAVLFFFNHNKKFMNQNETQNVTVKLWLMDGCSALESSGGVIKSNPPPKKKKNKIK